MRKYRWVLLGSVLLLLCCALSMCTASLLPQPGTAGWSAMAEVASTNRLMGFLGFLALGPGCTSTLIPGALIVILLAFILWRARPGGEW